jgi:hypothetical protein
MLLVVKNEHKTSVVVAAGVEEKIEDVNGVRDCDKSGRLPQLANCVRANAHKI